MLLQLTHEGSPEYKQVHESAGNSSGSRCISSSTTQIGDSQLLRPWQTVLMTRAVYDLAGKRL